MTVYTAALLKTELVTALNLTWFMKILHFIFTPAYVPWASAIVDNTALPGQNYWSGRSQYLHLNE
jgi:hypothetical protein